ncbi:MAG: NAD(P)H-dependent oxidoreductase [Actinobacteria bacterium]|nr:NAD(P)H-dependent oxidoreductase [Actinomycetota bacterium]
MTTPSGPRVLAIDCSPTGPGRTGNVLGQVLEASAAAGAAETSILHLGGEGATAVETAVAAMVDADAYVFGSPIYRATFAAPFKALLDATPRGMWGETEAPLTARAVAVVATGATAHHFLGLAGMRNVLVDFFAAHVVSPGLYVEHADFGEDRRLLPAAAGRAALQGTALVELARAISGSTALGAVTPQA